MTKETLGYVRLEWTCPNCGSKNPGPEKSCSECGGPQPEDVKFEQQAQEKLISDEAEIARAKTGPDVHCAFCGARNPAGAESCTQCGADLTAAEARARGRVVGAHRAKRAPDVACPSCGALNPANAHECAKCGASMARRERVARKATPSKTSNWRLIGAVVLGGIALLCVVFFILSSRTKDVTGKVQSVSWTRSIAIEELGPVEHEDWRSQIPSDANIGSCTQKAHHTQDSPAPDARKICGTPYTVDTGSGYGEVVQDCQYEVYRDWCEYTVEEWQQVDPIVIEGQDFNPSWPTVKLGPNQREGEREESYKCIFDSDGKTYTYNTRQFDAFTRCEIGSRWTLKVNTFNAVVDIESAK